MYFHQNSTQPIVHENTKIHSLLIEIFSESAFNYENFKFSASLIESIPSNLTNKLFLWERISFTTSPITSSFLVDNNFLTF